ncbi:cytochrome c [Nitrogeniibacter mangrovi]|uniref:Cytochrome c n=1 Tax=Nitrogeniibacter mangrovi TaxID=2016596 RepID=A0A6C1AZ53_9RHOO|nr:c-type cytochrome [Nitrogeniibacter mangrovi]QID16651.1 cytochrome c [Nitrogeniibacter mangrovi]
MKNGKRTFYAWLVLLLFQGGTSLAISAEVPDIGQTEYMNKCAVCHGASGKGDGGAVDLLKVAPADLTVLSKNNGGVFPVDRVYQVIDGRQVVRGHGSRDMPIWGNMYKKESAEAGAYFFEMPYTMDMYARVRILALIDYLSRIQSK